MTCRHHIAIVQCVEYTNQDLGPMCLSVFGCNYRNVSLRAIQVMKFLNLANGISGCKDHVISHVLWITMRISRRNLVTFFMSGVLLAHNAQGLSESL